MRRSLVELEIERARLGCVGIDPVPGLCAEDPGDVVAGRVTVEQAAPVRGNPVVVVVAPGETGEPVAPSGGGRQLVRDELLVAVQVLRAHMHRPVSGPVQPHRQHVVLGLQAGIPDGVRRDAVIVRVLTGDQRCARGTALGGGGNVIGEGRTVAREQSLRLRHYAWVELGEGLVIGPDQHDVRALLVPAGASRACRNRWCRSGHRRQEDPEKDRDARVGRKPTVGSSAPLVTAVSSAREMAAALFSCCLHDQTNVGRTIPLCIGVVRSPDAENHWFLQNTQDAGVASRPETATWRLMFAQSRSRPAKQKFVEAPRCELGRRWRIYGLRRHRNRNGSRAAEADSIARTLTAMPQKER